MIPTLYVRNLPSRDYDEFGNKILFHAVGLESFFFLVLASGSWFT